MSIYKLEFTSRGWILIVTGVLLYLLSLMMWRIEIIAYSTLLLSLLVTDIAYLLRCGMKCYVSLLECKIPRRVIVNSVGNVNLKLKVVGGNGILHIKHNVRYPLRITNGNNDIVVFKRGEDLNLKLNYDFKPYCRGEHKVGPLLAYFESPFRTLRLNVPVRGVKSEVVVDVVPQFYTIPVKPVSTGRRIIAPPGGHPIRREGSGVEFLHIRPYSIGDDYKRIAWKATAKNPRLEPLMKAVQSEVQLNVIVVVDACEPTLLGYDDVRILDDIVEAAGALLITAYKLGDRIGLLVLGGKRLFIPLSRRDDLLIVALKELETLWATFGTTDLYDIVYVIGRRVSKRSVILIFSTLSGGLKAVQNLIVGLRRLGHIPIILLPETIRYSPKPLDGEGFKRVHEAVIAYEQYRIRGLIKTILANGGSIELFNHQNAVEKALQAYYSVRGRVE